MIEILKLRKFKWNPQKNSQNNRYQRWIVRSHIRLAQRSVLVCFAFFWLVIFDSFWLTIQLIKDFIGGAIVKHFQNSNMNWTNWSIRRNMMICFERRTLKVHTQSKACFKYGPSWIFIQKKKCDETHLGEANDKQFHLFAYQQKWLFHNATASSAQRRYIHIMCVY